RRFSASPTGSGICGRVIAPTSWRSTRPRSAYWRAGSAARKPAPAGDGSPIRAAAAGNPIAPAVPMRRSPMPAPAASAIRDPSGVIIRAVVTGRVIAVVTGRVIGDAEPDDHLRLGGL